MLASLTEGIVLVAKPIMLKFNLNHRRTPCVKLFVAHVVQRSLHLKTFIVSRLTTAPEKCNGNSMMVNQT